MAGRFCALCTKTVPAVPGTIIHVTRNFFLPGRCGAAVLTAATLIISGCVTIPRASTSAPAQRREVTVAVSANARPLFEALRSGFQQNTGVATVVTYGASGAIFAQIHNGAPFDVFFSADSDFPHRLEQAGLTEPGSLAVYALGRLAVWVPRVSLLDLDRVGMGVLADPRVRRVVIANPDLAPYGSAAIAAMRNAGVYETAGRKLVLGESAAQAAQFLQSGSADAGIIPLSLALTPEMQAAGRYAEVPSRLYPPIEQAVVILRRAGNNEAARLLLDYLRSPEGADRLRRSGYAIPAAAAP